MDSDFWRILLDALIPLIGMVLGPLLLMLLKRGLDAFEKKTNLEISQDQRKMLEELIDKAINFAEEKARKAVKAEEAMEGNEKLDAALDFVKSAAKALGLDLKDIDLAAMIEARLFQKRSELTTDE